MVQKISWKDILIKARHINNRGKPAYLIRIIHSDSGELVFLNLFENGEEWVPNFPMDIPNPLCELLIETARWKKNLYFFNQEPYSITLEKFNPPDVLVLFGGGHVNEAMCTMGVTLGYRIFLWDDRPEYSLQKYGTQHTVFSGILEKVIPQIPFGNTTDIVIATRGHKFDNQVLEKIHHLPRRYLGVIGSRKKIRESFKEIKVKDPSFNPDSIYAPIGLDIDADSSPEIAIAILAEIIAHKRGKKTITFMKERT